MRRFLVLICAAGLAAAFILVPAFRRAVIRNSRIVLLILSGSILAAAVLRLIVPGTGLHPWDRDWFLAAGGTSVLGACFCWVLLDSIRQAKRRP